MARRVRNGSHVAVFAAVALALPLAGAPLACVRSAGGAGERVVVYSSVDQVFAEPILRDFERETGVRVLAKFDAEETKSTSLVNALLAERAAPRADVFWSGDPIRAIALARAGALAASTPAAASAVPLRYRDAEGRWTGFSARLRVLIWNTRRVPAGEVPRGAEELADPRWRGEVAIANPLFGTTSMHAAALFAAWGEERARAFFDGLSRNGARVVSSNGEVRRAVAAGECKLGICDSDDANVAQGEGKPVGFAPLDHGGRGVLLVPNAVALVAEGPNPAAGRRLIEWLLTARIEDRLARTEAAQIPFLPGATPPPGVPRLADLKDLDVPYEEVADWMDRSRPFFKQWAAP